MAACPRAAAVLRPFCLSRSRPAPWAQAAMRAAQTTRERERGERFILWSPGESGRRRRPRVPDRRPRRHRRGDAPAGRGPPGRTGRAAVPARRCGMVPGLDRPKLPLAMPSRLILPPRITVSPGFVSPVVHHARSALCDHRGTTNRTSACSTFPRGTLSAVQKSVLHVGERVR